MSVLVVPASEAAAAAVASAVPALVADKVASRITAGDATLWGPAAESEASIRLGWVNAVAVSRPLVADILALRDEFRAAGVDHIVLGGMGGSSLAPEVITATAGVPLTVLDSTDPQQVRSALEDRLASTAVVISSKSGSTVETDSQRRVYEAAFTAAGIDPKQRIVIVTDPGSPLDQSAREAGYRVFNADPNVGGRFSALTAFGLVPSGLAGVDIAALLDEAQAVAELLASDSEENPGLVLGAILAATSPRKDKVGIVTDDSPIVGFGDWAEQLLAESTGKEGTGVLPVVLTPEAPELRDVPSDLLVIRLVGNAMNRRAILGDASVSGPLGAQFVLWEYATSVAGRLLGINPFDQPDVESAKVAARSLLDARPEPTAPAFVESGVEVRAFGEFLGGADSLQTAIAALLAQLGADGYLAVQAYLDREALGEFAALRDEFAAATGRPVTFGWGPRFLHSTGQYHKGGVPNGVFLQLTAPAAADADLEIPERPFTFGQLIVAQAGGDAAVLAEHGRPVLQLTLSDPAAGLAAVRAALGHH